MCRCCQSCWEDCYWYCIEERFCFDKNIANYSQDEDEYFAKKKSKSLIDGNLDNIDRPICEQPTRYQDGGGGGGGVVGAANGPITSTNLCSKIREEDYRQIQTNVPFLAPEILAVFANSQIFHDDKPNKTLAIVHKSPSSVNGDKNARDLDTEKKLLKRLEGTDLNSDEDIKVSPTDNTTQSMTFREAIKKRDDELVLRPPMPKTPEPYTEYDEDNDENIVDIRKSPNMTLQNKRLRNIKSLPYFSFRPASENDIFTIAGTSQISMTPEIPSISYSALPKNFEDTPTINKYKEAVSLHSIQTAEIERANQFDFSMPRYFGKSDIIAQSVDSLPQQNNKTTPKKLEKSKRLKLIRTALPPLSIHINKEKSKEKNIE